MIDLHCHILPRLDDGAELLETSGDMAAALVRSGVSAVVCTPHMPGVGVYPLQRERIAEAYRLLVMHLEERQIPLKLIMSAEHNLNPLILQDSGKYLVPFGTGPNKSMVVELPWYDCPRERIGAMIFELESRGYTLILAHPERSPFYDIEWLEEQVNAGNFFLQIELGSLFGQYGRKAAKKAQDLLSRHLVHVAASDSHNVEHCRQVGDWIENFNLEYGLEFTTRLLEINPQAILDGAFWQVEPL